MGGAKMHNDPPERSFPLNLNSRAIRRCTMFRLNGFTITILQDHVEVSQANVRFTFKTLEEALKVLQDIS